MSDGFPSPETVAEQLGCIRDSCVDAATCWTRGGCVKRYIADPKSEPRIRDTAAMKRKMRTERECRVCESRATDPHHVVYRSRGGDDIEENIVGLCHDCHMTLHHAGGDDARYVRHEIGRTLRDEELLYAIRRLGPNEGPAFLFNAYGVPQERIDALPLRTSAITEE